MSFKSNETQQLTIDDRFLNLNPRTKKFVFNSWAKGFSDIVFPAINEQRFAVLYSNNPSSRPNAPVNAIIGSFILKELFGLTDDDLLASILCDVRFQFALRTTSFEEQPFSDRTFSRFRERLYRYEMETGIDLLREEMNALAEVFVKYLGIEPTLKRMDSLMVSSSAKRMTRLEILYTCVANVVKLVHRTGEVQYLKSLEHYLDAEDRNKMIYYRKTEEQNDRIQQVVNDALLLISVLPEAYDEFAEYQLLVRALDDQTEFNSEGNLVLQDKTKILPSSLQNPSDPDATYRSKAGKKHSGYVGNVVETFGEKGAIITDYDYKQNSHSDSEFCKSTVETLGPQEQPTVLLADGAYASNENSDLAEQNNIELVTTALNGKPPKAIHAKFELNRSTKEVTKCPFGYEPIKTAYYPSTGMYRASFSKATCSTCPLREECGVKMQQKSSVIVISEKMVDRSAYLEKMDSKEYRELSKKRNGVEGIPSILRRKYNVDQMPVRGLVRSKMWFAFKIAAINVKNLLKGVLLFCISLFISKKTEFYFEKTQIFKVEANNRSLKWVL